MKVYNIQNFDYNNSNIILKHEGYLTQPLIVEMVQKLENKNTIPAITKLRNIITIFIELSQNILKYSKKVTHDKVEFDPYGLLIIGVNPKEKYYVLSENIIDQKDKEKLDQKLSKIMHSDTEGINRLYKETRKNENEAHKDGAGIGFYEIAKRSSNISYRFESIDKNKFNFTFLAIV